MDDLDESKAETPNSRGWDKTFIDEDDNDVLFGDVVTEKGKRLFKPFQGRQTDIFNSPLRKKASICSINEDEEVDTPGSEKASRSVKLNLNRTRLSELSEEVVGLEGSPDSGLSFNSGDATCNTQVGLDLTTNNTASPGQISFMENEALVAANVSMPSHVSQIAHSKESESLKFSDLNTMLYGEQSYTPAQEKMPTSEPVSCHKLPADSLIDVNSVKHDVPCTTTTSDMHSATLSPGQISFMQNEQLVAAEATLPTDVSETKHLKEIESSKLSKVNTTLFEEQSTTPLPAKAPESEPVSNEVTLPNEPPEISDPQVPNLNITLFEQQFATPVATKAPTSNPASCHKPPADSFTDMDTVDDDIHCTTTISDIKHNATLSPGLTSFMQNEQLVADVVTSPNKSTQISDPQVTNLNITLFEQQFARPMPSKAPRAEPVSCLKTPSHRSTEMDTFMQNPPCATPTLGDMLNESISPAQLSFMQNEELVAAEVTLPSEAKLISLPKVTNLDFTLFEQQFATPVPMKAPSVIPVTSNKTPAGRLVDVTIVEQDDHRKSSLGILPRHMMQSARLSFLSSMTSDNESTPPGTFLRENAGEGSATSLELLPRDLLNFSTPNVFSDDLPNE